MPQMAPMWWLTLMIMVIVTMITMNSMLYFNFKSFMKIKTMENKKMKMKW
nr:ATP synthase F0 subunit 8 [Planaphrodes nigricans]WRK21235.1 ATP synthase F0 subunit 8 [Planaphrodes nigricans]